MLRILHLYKNNSSHYVLSIYDVSSTLSNFYLCYLICFWQQVRTFPVSPSPVRNIPSFPMRKLRLEGVSHFSKLGCDKGRELLSLNANLYPFGNTVNADYQWSGRYVSKGKNVELELYIFKKSKQEYQNCLYFLNQSVWKPKTISWNSIRNKSI